MATVSEHVSAVFKAKNMILQCIPGPIPGTDLIEVLANQICGEGDPDMTVDEVLSLVCTVARQRTEGNIEES